MADIKKLGRLQASATVSSEGSTIVVTLAKHEDGGSFDLHPFSQLDGDTAGIYFPAADAAGYTAAIKGDVESLGRLARAILALERKAKGGDEETATTE